MEASPEIKQPCYVMHQRFRELATNRTTTFLYKDAGRKRVRALLYVQGVSTINSVEVRQPEQLGWLFLFLRSYGNTNYRLRHPLHCFIGQ